MTSFLGTNPFKCVGSAPLLCLLFALGGGCHSGTHPPGATVHITKAPPVSAGGPVQMDYIEGRTTEATAGDQVVLYARSGIWWIQPFANQPFTNIQPDGGWRNTTHLGTEYAALLVAAGYHPTSKLKELPAPGGGVVAVAVLKAESANSLPEKVLHFSGYDWRVRTAGSDRGGMPNVYSSENAWTDDKGSLHLRMQERDGVWTCAEVSLTRSLGYGSYQFVVQDSNHLSPSGVLGLYTADDFRTDDSRSELDVELSRWGRPDSKNAQFVVQPFYVPENVFRFMAPAGALTHMFRWEPGRASFETVRGTKIESGSTPISSHAFTSGIPTPANERVHIDLYDYRHSKNSLQQPAEVVIEKFEFLP